MRVLVTGGAGFIGSHIVDLLIKKGFQIAVVDDLSHGRKENVHKKASFFHEDINSPHLSRIFNKFKPQIVNHQAALINVQESLKHPLKDVQINVSGTLNIIEKSEAVGVKQFIFASSVAVYGDSKKLPIKENDSIKPISIYALSKATAEFYVKLYQERLKPTILRYANVYGPRQDSSAEGGVVAIFAKKLQNGKAVIIYGDGKQTRDFVFVEDIAQANYQAICKKASGIFNISTGKETSILELYKLCQKLTFSTKRPIFQPTRPGDLYRSVLDNGVAYRELGWQPRTALFKNLKKTFLSFE